MSMTNRDYGVWLYDRRVGTITLNSGVIRFQLDDDYIHDKDRSVLGLKFEDDLSAVHRSKMRLPPWFSNLLPEGRLREWIAQARGVSENRELDLLLQVGNDLPGAVRVAEADSGATVLDFKRREIVSEEGTNQHQNDIWRFSLAGVALKFSMLRSGERFTAPGSGEGGDWIVKLPDSRYPQVPINEFAMMKLAHKVGIEVPEVRLVHRNQLADVPEGVWPNSEDMAYAIRRFDRNSSGGLIHMEDFAQVRGFYPDIKYKGSFETLAALIYRNRDLSSLVEFTKRLAFNYLIGNGDAHLKNWSLIYEDPRVPRLSPAYDLVATSIYRPAGNPEDLGLKFAKSRKFESVTLASFERLSRKLNVSGVVSLQDEAHSLILKVTESWPEIADMLSESEFLQEQIGNGISERTAAILNRPPA